jgi:hypothetical protein
MLTLSYRSRRRTGFAAVWLFLSIGLMIGAGSATPLRALGPPAGDAPLNIVARRDLQGPSQWGVPPDYRLIRSGHELVRAVGIDVAEQLEREFGRPRIDYRRYMLAYVSAGSRRSSGFAVNILDVVKRSAAAGAAVRVRWSLYEPQGVVLMVITTPAQIVMIDRADGEPEFEHVPSQLATPEPAGEKATATGRPTASGTETKRGAAPADSAPNWERLVRNYTSLGLARPAADSALVAHFYDMELVEERDLVIPLHRPRYFLGFLASAAGSAKEKQLLIGTETQRCSAEESSGLVKIESIVDLPGRIMTGYDARAFEINVALPTAIECYRRGQTELADELLRLQADSAYGHPQSIFYQPAGLSPAAALRFIAWTHWGNQLADAGSDRTALHKRMSELLRDEPSLRTPERVALLDSLAAALVPSKAPAGSAERLVDDLVELDALYFARQAAVGLPAPLAELTQRGGDALPTLLAHLEDRRLTRSLVRPWNGSASYLAEVGELVGNVVQDFAGDEGRDWKRSATSHFLEPEVVRAWWRHVQDLGEEAYLVKAAVPQAPQTERAYDAIVRRIAHKYPRRLPEVYRRLLAERPDVGTWNVVMAIVASTDGAAQSDALTAGTEHANLARRLEALEALSVLDPARFESLLLRNLPTIADKPAGPPAFSDQVRLARLCWKTERADIWSALCDATTKADVGIKLEIIEDLTTKTEMQFAERKRLTEFLGSFLDDATIRDAADDPQKYEGCAGRRWPKLEVRNWAAYQLATVLAVDVAAFDGGRAITDEQWARLRKAVAARLAEFRYE